MALTRFPYIDIDTIYALWTIIEEQRRVIRIIGNTFVFNLLSKRA